MPRNEYENDERSKTSGARDAQAEGTIEARIAHWQRTGENDAAVRRDILAVMLEQEGSLARARGKQIARDVVESYAIVQEKTRTHFDATRRFRPWLRELLLKQCIDVYRSKPKQPDGKLVDIEFDERTMGMLVDEEQDDILAVTTAESANEIAKLIADCIKRPYQRLIFSGASGIARFLSLDVLIEWCRALGRDPAIAEGVQRIAADKTHGRLASLAHILGSREDTVRQNFKRAFAKVNENGKHPLIHRLIISRRKQRP